VQRHHVAASRRIAHTHAKFATAGLGDWAWRWCPRGVLGSPTAQSAAEKRAGAAAIMTERTGLVPGVTCGGLEKDTGTLIWKMKKSNFAAGHVQC